MAKLHLLSLCYLLLLIDCDALTIEIEETGGDVQQQKGSNVQLECTVSYNSLTSTSDLLNNVPKWTKIIPNGTPTGRRVQISSGSNVNYEDVPERYTVETGSIEENYPIISKHRNNLKIQGTQAGDAGTLECSVGAKKVTYSLIMPEPVKKTVLTLFTKVGQMGTNSSTVNSGVRFMMVDKDILKIQCSSYGGFPIPRIEMRKDSVNITDQLGPAVTSTSTPNPNAFDAIEYEVTRSMNYNADGPDNFQEITCAAVQGDDTFSDSDKADAVLDIEFGPIFLNCSNSYAEIDKRDFEYECNFRCNPEPSKVSFGNSVVTAIASTSLGTQMRNDEGDENDNFMVRYNRDVRDIYIAILTLDEVRKIDLLNYEICVANRLSEQCETFILTDTNPEGQPTTGASSLSALYGLLAVALVTLLTTI